MWLRFFFNRFYNYNLDYIQQVLFVNVNKNVQVYGY
jgi:hypothetical protein